MKLTRIITIATLALFSFEGIQADAEELVVAPASVLQIRLPPPPPRPPAPPNPFRRRHRRVRRHKRFHIKLPPRPPAPPNPLHLPTPPRP